MRLWCGTCGGDLIIFWANKMKALLICPLCDQKIIKDSGPVKVMKEVGKMNERIDAALGRAAEAGDCTHEGHIIEPSLKKPESTFEAGIQETIVQVAKIEDEKRQGHGA